MQPFIITSHSSLHIIIIDLTFNNYNKNINISIILTFQKPITQLTTQ